MIVALLFGAFITAAPASAAPAAEIPTAAVTAAGDGSARCAAVVSADAPAGREINLVIDDSGSMFRDLKTEVTLDRWSKAKYALEVFAAMLAPDDVLNVYRMSDFSQGRSGSVAVTVTGAESTSARAKQIHDMPMQGVDTPFSSVAKAQQDLAASQSMNKWLVIITDGEFEDTPAGGAEKQIRSYPTAADADQRLRVAYLAIGEDAPAIADDPGHGIHFSKAPDSQDLLEEMTGFANLIFERNLIASASQPNVIDPDIDLAEVLVFAQGAKASIGDAVSESRAYPPESTVSVRWAENAKPADDWVLEAKPDKDLNGVLARFTDVERGPTQFDITGASDIAYFYKPAVNFGIELRDESGAVVDADKIVGGEYTLRYGFMDADCAFIESPLIGDVTYSARAFSGEEMILESVESGQTISLDRGDVRLEVDAEYLGGNTAHATIDVTVLQPARATGFDMAETAVAVTELGEEATAEPIAVEYGLGETGALTSFTDEEWAAVSPEAFSVTTPSNLFFDVALGDSVGEVLLTPRAPDGDVYAADTGEIPVTLEASFVYDEQLYQATPLESTLTVDDDIAAWDRFTNWFAETGWKWLLALILLVILLGYLFKPRFSKKIKRRPAVAGIPMSIGVKAETGNGKFQVQPLRKYLPFFADRATLNYVPQGTFGFRQMTLKAGRSGKMTLLNWKQIADKKNVALNGNDLNEDTKRAPTLSASTSITATVPNQTRFELYLNN